MVATKRFAVGLMTERYRRIPRGAAEPLAVRFTHLVANLIKAAEFELLLFLTLAIVLYLLATLELLPRSNTSLRPQQLPSEL